MENTKSDNEVNTHQNIRDKPNKKSEIREANDDKDHTQQILAVDDTLKSKNTINKASLPIFPSDSMASHRQVLTSTQLSVKQDQLIEIRKFPDTPISQDNARKIFFKPLNKNTSRESIISCLERFGKVEYLRVPYSNKKRKNLGYGFVIFESNSISDLLCRHKIKTKIDDKIVGFSRFDVLKYKSKNMDSEASSEPVEEGLDDLKLPSNKSRADNMEKMNIDVKSHFRKPTKNNYYSIARHHIAAKYKYNLEKLPMKSIRDMKAASSLSKLKSTIEES